MQIFISIQNNTYNFNNTYIIVIKMKGSSINTLLKYMHIKYSLY